MRDSLRAVVAATDARTLHDNTAFAEAFARVLDESELQRVILAETVWKDGLQARERGDVEEATMLFEAAIDGRGKGLCDDIKAGRDRVVDMRRELLTLHVGGGAVGGVGDLLGGFLGRCACCSLLAPSLIEDNDYKEKVAWGKYNLASDLDDRGDYDDALALYEEALLLFTEACGHNSLEVAATTGRIASVYGSQGKYDEALVEYQKSLDITIQVVGHDHPDVATTHNNIANVYFSQGKYDEALEFHHKAEKVRVAVYGHAHPDVADTLLNTAVVYRKQGKYDEALDLYHKAEKVRVAVFGHAHPLVADTKYNIANVYKNQGKLEEARQLYLECEQIYTKVYGAQHSETLDAARKAASCVMST